MRESIIIRSATLSDLDGIFRVESNCFPPAEAAGKAAIKKRLATYPHHYILLFSGGELAAYINGAVTRAHNLEDYMFSDASVHDEKGGWQMIFGLCTAPSFRGKGYASLLLRRFILQAEEQGRKGLVLTCKPGLVNYYSSFGFEDEGVCPSAHGGAVWHQMRLTF